MIEWFWRLSDQKIDICDLIDPLDLSDPFDLDVIFQLDNKCVNKSGKLQQQSTNFGFKELVSNLPMLCTE